MFNRKAKRIKELERGYSMCIRDLESWGSLARSSDYWGPEDDGYFGGDLLYHEGVLGN